MMIQMRIYQNQGIGGHQIQTLFHPAEELAGLAYVLTNMEEPVIGTPQIQNISNHIGQIWNMVKLDSLYMKRNLAQHTTQEYTSRR